jgi:hypothetical protein
MILIVRIVILDMLHHRRLLHGAYPSLLKP